jgi:mannuronan synthase
VLNVLKHVAFILFVVAFAVAIPDHALGDKSRDAFVLVGIIGMWRYSWGLLHFVRCLWFKFVAFPKARRAADLAAQQTGFGHSFLLVTSFRIDAETTSKVYHAAFEAAARAPGGGTVVASIVEMSDERLIQRIADAVYGVNKPFRLKFVRIPGTGKRDALANGMMAIVGFKPGRNDTVSFIDGDSIVPPDLIEKCASMFLLDQTIGALTTDEICTVEGAEIFKHWYSLRFAQRNILMSSHGLARRVLTLTGRMSMFRASLACDPGFIDQIQNDYIDHWRLGRIRMLTGDDKSTWYWMLSRGYKTYYVPDVQVQTIEQPPSPSFVGSAAVLMTRWFGNMLRTNSRAIALGPLRISPFTWWSIIDQRLSMWTCLSGLVLTALGSLIISPWVIAYYILWVLVSRYILTLSLLVSRPSVSLAYIPLLYFNQVFGSIVKIYVFFRLDRQKWTRQKTSLSVRSSSRELLVKLWSSRLMTAVAVVAYVSFLAILTGLSQRQVSSSPLQQIVKLETVQ